MGMRNLLLVTALVAVTGSPATAQNGGGGAVEIPLRVQDGRLIVPVEAADGTVLDFALSTGNGQTVLTESVAARLEDHGELTLGGLPVPMEDMATTSDESLTADGGALAGMIGGNMLSRFDMLIDVPGERLVLRPVGRSVSWDGVTLSDPIRLRILHGFILSLDVELNGTQYPAMLDVGTAALVVNEPVKAHAQLADEDVATLTLGSTVLPDLPVKVRDLDMFRMWDPNGKGFVLVGAPVAYDCAISVSWVRQEVRTCVR